MTSFAASLDAPALRAGVWDALPDDLVALVLAFFPAPPRRPWARSLSEYLLAGGAAEGGPMRMSVNQPVHAGAPWVSVPRRFDVLLDVAFELRFPAHPGTRAAAAGIVGGAGALRLTAAGEEIRARRGRAPSLLLYNKGDHWRVGTDVLATPFPMIGLGEERAYVSTPRGNLEGVEMRVHFEGLFLPTALRADARDRAFIIPGPQLLLQKGRISPISARRAMYNHGHELIPGTRRLFYVAAR